MALETRPIPSCPGYFARAGGKIIGLRGMVLKAPLNGCGYPCVRIYGANRAPRTVPVHRLVCEAFHGPCPEGYDCRHLNGVRTDNRPENLAWGSRSENHRDKRGHGTCKIDRTDMVVMRGMYEAGETQSEIARLFGMSRGYVGCIVRGEVV